MEGNPLRSKLELGVARPPTFGPLALDLQTRTMKIEGSEEMTKLTPFEYQMLWVLVRAQGAIVSTAEIENFLYDDLPDGEDIPLYNTVDVHMLRLRKKLRQLTGGKVTIDNNRAVGFQLVVN